MTPTDLKAALRTEALRLGFGDMGVAAAGPSDPDGHLQRWLDAGMHGEMHYLARTLADRLDTRALCNGRAKTVVMLLNCPGWRVLRYSVMATRATAPPPRPLNKATIWGIAVI